MAAPPMRRGPPDGWQKWHIIYPCYVDSSKKCSEGRKVSLAKCKDCDTPNTADIAEALMAAGFPPQAILVENTKRHPRDFFADGRIRVKLQHDDGTPTVAAYPTKMKTLEAVGKHIPSLPSRPIRLERMKEHEAAMKANIMSMFSGKKPPIPSGMRPPPGAAGAARGGAAAGSDPKGGTSGKKKKSTKGKVVKRKGKK